MFDKSNNIKIKDYLKKHLSNNNSLEGLHILQDWRQITEQFNQEIYKLVLSKFNKKYQIKTIIL